LLLLLTSSLLFAAAVIAYTSFYYAYIPIRGLQVPIYLQYEHSPSVTSLHDTPALDVRIPKQPYGIANVDGLISRQKYDVEVTVVLPRSENNLAAGNWMIGLDMRGPGTRSPGIKSTLGWEDDWEVEDYSQGPNFGITKESISKDEAVQGSMQKTEVLARSRRPSILTYRSWLTERCYRALRLPLYVVGLGTESETVSVMVMEGVQFDKGWRNVPTSMRLELRSKIPLEVYRVSVRFVAKLEGLRWVMYTHRLTSAAVFIAVFWAVEMGVLLFTWALFAFCLGKTDDENGTQGGNKIKAEHADSEPPTPMSDTNRTFPTLSSQQPLHYSSSSPKEERATPALEDIPTKEEAEADDEEDDFLLEEPIPNSAAGVLTDSGIGTSMESSVEQKGLSRRKSQRDR
jgi:seipin